MLKEVEAVDIIGPQVATLMAAAEILKGRPDFDYSTVTEPVCYDKWQIGRPISTYEQKQPFILLIKLANSENPRFFNTALTFIQLNGFYQNGACEPELNGESLSPTIFWPRDWLKPLILENDTQRLDFRINLPKQLNPRYTGTMTLWNNAKIFF